MVSISYSEGFYYRPRIDKELLERYHEGLIVTGAACLGEIRLMQSQPPRRCQAKHSLVQRTFGDDYYLSYNATKPISPEPTTETYEIQGKSKRKATRVPNAKRA